MLTWVAIIQSIYFIATGIWPLLHLPSFLAVTGPKHDLWLVRTVGVLVFVIGMSLAVAVQQHQMSSAIATLAIGSALSLAAADVIYVARGTIGRIYLLDAFAEAILIAAWIVGYFVDRA